MAFSSGNKGVLQYAERSSLSGVWSITTVESQGAPRNDGQIQVAFDSTGNPAIAYNVFNTSQPVLIKFARRVGAVWQKQTVRTTLELNSLSLAFDGTQPIIAHADDTNGDNGNWRTDTVRLMRLTGSTWSSEVVETDMTV